MYKLIIADDEPLVQVGIKSMLPWESMNIEITGVASNGKIALDMINKDKPDIVITDIKMPIMSGLELAEECRKAYGDDSPYFIILTSYEEFDLARKALTLRVSDYLVKLDLTPETLKNSIEKITKLLNKENTPKASSYGFKDKFFTNLFCNFFETRGQFESEAKQLEIAFESPAYLCAYCEFIGTSDSTIENQMKLYHSSFQMLSGLSVKYAKCYSVMLDLHHCVIIFCLDNTDSIQAVKLAKSTITSVSNTLKSYYSVSIKAGIGSVVSDPLLISESYQFAREVLSSSDKETEFAVFNEDDRSTNSFNFAIFKDSLVQAYDEYDSESLSRIIDDITALFKANPSHFLQAIDFAGNMIYLSISLLQNGEETVTNIFKDYPSNYRSLYKMTSMDQIIAFLVTLKTGLCDYFTEKKKEVKNPVVAQVRHYIKEHVSDHLSLNEVATVFCITPNYLSQLFKKYNDCGYNDFVTQCKIEEAKRLLASGNMKIYEVADSLGFESAFYFSKVFKKVVGIPPTDYHR